MMIDGELTETQTRRVRAHLAECPACQDLEKDFLFFRGQINKLAEGFITSDEKPQIANGISIWKKGISFPIPLFAVVLLVVAGLSIGLIIWRSDRSGKAATENPGKTLPAKNVNEGEVSISRFDKGRRAEIYIQHR